MKTSTLLILGTLLLQLNSFATKHNINTSGTTYSPSTLAAQVGDTLVIQASNMHPCVQVSETSWNNNTATELSGGWGTKNSNFEYVITTNADIYYVCANHVGSGMKGKVTVTTPTGIEVNNSSIINVFPVPVNNKLTVTISSLPTANMEIYDLKGQLIYTTKLFNGNNNLDLDLPAGNYIYQIYSNENAVVKVGKIIRL